ncbi:MAG: VPLPA-CTERM sorting domain-containing protein [Thermodesulfobacteriota bacterium]
MRSFWIALLGALMMLLSVDGATAGPYAPAAGQLGSTAIYMNDPQFLGWATGWEDYQVGANVSASWQTPEKALGQAVGSSFDIVCLGDGGAITLTFDTPIGNGDGWDFAVFENSFNDTFLELAYVEVSSNGVDFFRFTNDSLTSGPVGGFGAVDPTNIDGLAGKYRQGYGTPFDLAELAGLSAWLDISSIGWVRLIDIVGDGTCLDSSGNVIYDPHPTSGSAGFDLDAIGVIHQAAAPVPIPGAIWLLGSGLIGLTGLRKMFNF